MLASGEPFLDGLKEGVALEGGVPDGGAEGSIEIEVEAGDQQFKIVIRDTGRIFNPESIPDPDMKEHVQRGHKKGLGIFLMRQIMDEVRYKFKDGVKNELTLVKFIR